MPRISRKDLKTPFIHVMVQGVNKEYIFNNEKYINEYLKMISNIKKNYNLEILAYCIMNNHAHFLIYTKNIEEFGEFMQKVNLHYVQFYNKKENRYGVLFRNRYKSEPTYDSKYLLNCIKYIHNNPVKANIVEKCGEYKYSSYGDYINNVGLSQAKILKEIFGNNCNYAKMFNYVCDKKYMDIEADYCINDYIQGGIKEFKNIKNIDLSLVLSNRIILKELILFLKETWGIQYTDIRNFFNISRGIMDKLKLR